MDLSGLSEGEYTLPITVDEELYPNLTFSLEPESVSLRLDGSSDTNG